MSERRSKRERDCALVLPSRSSHGWRGSSLAFAMALVACSSAPRDNADAADEADIAVDIDADSGSHDDGGQDASSIDVAIGDVDAVDAPTADTADADVADGGDASLCAPDQLEVDGVCRRAPMGGCVLGEQPAGVAGLCRRACDDSLDCPPGARCDAAVCVVGCESSDECAEGEACADSRCRPVCSNDDTCDNGTCVGGACLPSLCIAACGVGQACRGERCVTVGSRVCESDAECSPGQRCDGECVESNGAGVGFEFRQTGLHLHDYGSDGLGENGFGAAAALGDFDGDGDIDVALNRDDQGTGCVYWNTEGSFAPRRETCDDFRNAESFAAGDLDGDGRDELIIGGLDDVSILSPDSNTVLATLTLSGVSPDRPAAISSFLLMDEDADGAVDLYVGLSGIARFGGLRPVRPLNRVVRVTTDPWSLDESSAPTGLEDVGHVNALSLFDREDDGFYELFMANDSFSNDEFRNTIEPPGTLATLSALEDGGSWLASPITPDTTAWGSFMGGQWITWQGVSGLYVTDWTSNRFFVWDDDGVTDRAAELGLALRQVGDELLFSWSTVSADLDLDGDRDLLISNGSPADGVPNGERVHRTSALFQPSVGRAERVDTGLGFVEPGNRVGANPLRLPSSRSLLPFDADGDGRLDVLLTHLLGFTELYEESTIDPHRCQLIVRPSIVVGTGWGAAWAPSRDATWRREQNSGHTLSHPGPVFIADRRRGVLRFPSGAAVDFDCAEGTPVLVEPEWIAWNAETTSFDIDEDLLAAGRVFAIEAAVRDAAGVRFVDVYRSVATGRWVVDGAGEDADVMLRLNGRWVWRWW